MEYATRESLAADLRRLGVTPGGVVLVHSSYKSLGFVAGGPQAVVLALLDAAGTVVVPTHTPENSDPATWSNPPVPEDWWAGTRRHTPGFDTARTPANPHTTRTTSSRSAPTSRRPERLRSGRWARPPRG